MERHKIALGLSAALACFCAGIAAAQLFGAPPAPSKASSPAPALDGGDLPAALGLDASARAPKILFDPDNISLLPDASLELKLPPGFDAGDP